MRSRSLTAILIFLSSSTAALAARTEVKAQGSGRTPFEIVYGDDEKEKERGIYVLAANGAHLAIPGEVLGVGRHFNGILRQLELTHRSSRDESLAIVDGKLVLFSNKSRAGNEEAIVELGTKKMPLHDILTDLKVELGPIAKAEDVSVFSALGTNGSNTVLISVRQPSALGTGLTFAFTLALSDSGNLGLGGVNKLLLIDHSFLSQKQLSELCFPGESSKVLSRSATLNFARPNSADSEVLKEWKASVLAELDKIYGVKSTKKNKNRIIDGRKIHNLAPYFNLIQRKFEMHEALAWTILDDPFEIELHLNPITGQNTVSVDSAVTIPGALDYEPKDDTYELFFTFQGDNAAYEPGAAIAAIDDYYYALLRTDKGKAVAVKLEQKDSLEVSKNALVHRKLGGFHYFILSRKYSRPGGTNTENTVAYVIREVGTGGQLEKKILLNQRFIEDKELELRTVVRTKKDVEDESKADEEENEKKVRIKVDTVAFDYLAPASGYKKYKASLKSRATAPYMDLVNTTDKKIEQVHLEALDSRMLVSPFLSYRHFETRGATDDKSGVFLHGLDDNVINFVPGQLLLRKQKNSSKKAEPVLDMVRVEGYDDSLPSVSIALIPIDREPAKKLKKFDVLIALLPDEMSGRVAPQMTSMTIEADFSQLLVAKVIAGKRKHIDKPTILFFFKAPGKDDPGSRLSKGGVYAVPLVLEYKTLTGRTHVTVHQDTGSVWLEREAVQPETLKHRIVLDKEGDLYWISNPNVSNTSGSFAVRKLERPNETIYPNRADSRVSLRIGESFEEKWGPISGILSHWSVYTTNDLLARYPQLEKELELIKTNKNKRQLFPEFEGHLDELATLKATPERTVLLVEENLKEFFKKTLLLKLASKKGSWSLRAKDFYFYLFEPSASKKEMASELEILQDKGINRKDVLYVEASELLSGEADRTLGPDNSSKSDSNGEEDGIEEEEQEENDSEKRPIEKLVNPLLDLVDDDEETSSTDFSRVLMLATDGKAANMSQLKKLRNETFKSKIPMVILATPAEWRKIRETHSREEKAGAFNAFHLNARYLTTPWTMWGPNSDRATKETRAMHRLPLTEDEQKVFPNLGSILTEATQKSSTGKTRVVIVNDELKDLIRRMILSRWASDSPQLTGDSESFDGQWNYKNHNLALYRLTPPDHGHATNQTAIFDLFESMRSAAKYRHVVLLGELEDILRVGRPVSFGKPSYFLKDPAVRKGDELLAQNGDQSVEGVRAPHILWNIVTEGQKVPAAALAKNKEINPPKMTNVLFGTEREWNALQQETAFERKFGLDDQFEVVRLNPPTNEIKLALLEGLLKRPEIFSLDYRFEVEGASPESSREQILALLVSRTEQIARQQKQEPTSAFIRMYGQFRRSLSEDIDLRRTKVIDTRWAQRLFARVFSIPMNIDTLPDNDPYRKLADPDAAAIKLQLSGYEGPLELKSRVIETALSVTRGSDEGRPIPNSTILFGGTSTGKTFLFKKIAEFLELKSYDFTKPDAQDAGSFVINLANVVEEADKANPALIPIADVLKHLSNFISLPNGYKGFILLDDVHKARSTKILREIMTFVQSLFDAKDGLVRVTRISTKEVHEVPVRNFNLYMTINPTMDREKRDRYIDVESDNLIEHVIAALAREDYTVEESVFARWSDIVNLDKFPAEAKVPTLLRKVRAAAQQEYSSLPRLALVSSKLLENIVRRFPAAHAREFLSAATHSLLGMGREFRKAPAMLILPREDRPPEGMPKFREEPFFDEESAHDEFGTTKSAQIEAFVQEAAIVRPLSSSDPVSNIEFLSFMMEGFRIQMLEQLLEIAQQEQKISGTFERRNAVLSSMLLGTLSHLVEKPRIPLTEMSLNPRDFGWTSDLDIEKTHIAIQQHSASREEPFFPFEFDSHRGNHGPSLQEFLTGMITAPTARGRAELMADTSGKIEATLLEAMTAYYRFQYPNEPVQPEEWIRRIEEKDPEAVFRKTGTKLVELYLRFTSDLYDSDLKEMREKKKAREMSSYDKMRLFLFCVDKALTNLPWAHATQFMVRVLEKASGDLSLGQRPEFQHYLFDSTLSPLRTVSRDIIVQTAKSSKAYLSINKEARNRLRGNFIENCDKFVMSRKVDGTRDGE